MFGFDNFFVILITYDMLQHLLNEEIYGLFSVAAIDKKTIYADLGSIFNDAWEGKC